MKGSLPVLLFSLFSSGDLRSALIGLALTLPAVLLCLSVHELSHGFAAYLLGDRTASNQGRLTIDPFAHIDPVGFLCMVVFGFGWARPVPVNISNFRNRRAGMGITAAAGPLSNFILAFLAFFLSFACELVPANGMAANFMSVLMTFLQYVGILSVGLGVFNLIPVYPLDGSRILDAAMPFSVSLKLQKYQQFIFIGLIALVWLGGLDSVIAWVWQNIFLLSRIAFSSVLG